MSKLGLIAVFCVATCGVALATEVPFGPPQNISTTGEEGRIVIAADLDGDGDLDVIESQGTGNPSGLYWHENLDGEGTLGPEQVIDDFDGGLFNPLWASAVDMDLDGDLDVLTGTPSSISWYPNDGGGGFGARNPVSNDAGALIVEAVAADLDSDGDMDVVSCAQGNDTIAWYENEGGGDFGDPNSNQNVISTAADSAQDCTVADLDGDGDGDVVSVSFNDNKTAWYANNGVGEFGPQQVITTAAVGPFAVDTADIDGDGDLDVITAAGADLIAWSENVNGDGSSWQLRTISASFDRPLHVFTVDLDLDGDVDVMSASSNDDTIAWHENLGGGTSWTSRTLTSTAEFAIDVHAADLDGDGDPDALWAALDGGQIAWQENRTIHRNAAFPETETIASGLGRAQWVMSADLDNDGDLDVVAAGADDIIAWYRNTDGSGGFAFAQTVSTAADDPRSVIAADLDGDGDLDLASASENDNKIAWYKNTDGAGTFSSQKVISTLVTTAKEIVAGDIDNDGDIDLAAVGEAGHDVVWFRNDGLIEGQLCWEAQFVEQGETSFAEFPEGLVLVDLDQDGDLDLVVAEDGDDESGNSEVSWARNTGGTFGRLDMVLADLPDFAGAENVSSGDIDNDGDPDLLVSVDGDGQVLWLENDGTDTNWPQHVISNQAGETEWVMADDLDLDGDLDVLVTSALNETVGWHENLDGEGNFGPHQLIRPFRRDIRHAFTGDLDGDGDPDVISTSRTNGRVQWHPNRGGQFTLAASGAGSRDAFDGELAPLMAVGARLNGRSGDPVGLLDGFEIRFTVGEGGSLGAAQADELFTGLRVYRDMGDDTFDALSDALLLTTTPDLDEGSRQLLSLPAADPNSVIAGPGTFFVVAEMAADASSSETTSFNVELPDSSGVAFDQNSGIRLSQEVVESFSFNELSPMAQLAVDDTDDRIDIVPGDGICETDMGTCSLRAAIMEANARSGDNRITLPAGTYLLTRAGTGEDGAVTGDLDIDDEEGSLTLVGAGADGTIIDADGLDRVFHISSTGDLLLEGLTIQGGDTPSRGGGIWNDGGYLTLSDCRITDNSSSDTGGGLSNDGYTEIERSTFDDNFASDQGSAIDSQNDVYITNSTFSGNRGADALRQAYPGLMEIISSTITDSDGFGIFNDAASVSLTSTIVAANGNGDVTGDFTSDGHNLIGDLGEATGFSSGLGDQVGGEMGEDEVPEPPLDPMLDVLGFNGGSTPTHPLGALSPAIDRGSCPDLDSDQRGLSRPIDVPGFFNADDGCDVGAYEARLEQTAARLTIPIRWCGVRGAPSIEIPARVGAETPNDVMRKRHERVTKNIYGPQANIAFQSAGNLLVEEYPLLEDPDCVEQPSGSFLCERGQRGDVYIDPSTIQFDEFQQLVTACREAWHEQDPDIVGLTALHVNRFVDDTGAPLDILGLGGRALVGDAAEQAVVGRVAVVDNFYRLDVPGNPSPPNPPDVFDRLLGHEFGHGLALPHGNGLDDDGNGQLDDNDDPGPRFDGPNLMQYRAGSLLTIEQSLQMRDHAALAVPDTAIQPVIDSIPDGSGIESENARVLEFGFDALTELENARVTEFENARVLEFENARVTEFENARVAEFENARVVEFENARVLEFGVGYVDSNPTSMARLRASVGSLPWPAAIRPTTRFFFYLDLDRSDATGGYPADETNPSTPGLKFPGSNNFTNEPDVAEEAGVDLIAQVELFSTCPDETCESFSQLKIFTYDGEVFQLRSTIDDPSITAAGVGLYRDNGGQMEELEDVPSGIVIQPEIPNSLLFEAGWGFEVPPGGGPSVPNRIKMEVVTSIDCTGTVLNDDPSSAPIDCQCTDCEVCPEYPGCDLPTPAPKMLASTTILADCKAGELTFEPGAPAGCNVWPVLAEEGQIVTVNITNLPTDLTGDEQVEVSLDDQVLALADRTIIDANGSATLQVPLPPGNIGDLDLSAGLTGLAPRANCFVMVKSSLDCPDNDADGECDGDDDDDDNDDVPDGMDSDRFNPRVCRDTDNDDCDDCSSGTDDPQNDGDDFDMDGLCDRGDPDQDDDSVLNPNDGEPFNPNACGDTDDDRCDDCLNGSPNPANDGDDFDSDGICDFGDNCETDSNATQIDTDGDGFGDACDEDADGDGVPNDDDTLPFDPSRCQDEDMDGCDDCSNGLPANTMDDGADADSDGICDAGDNCITLSNPLQEDTDQDGKGDTCDDCPLDNPDDSDGDGVCDTDDDCPVDNPDDTDGDGVCDSDDPCPVDNPDDTDGDGACDTDDICPLDNPDDTDGDGVCDTDDICPLDNPDDSDGDGVCDTDDDCPVDNPDDTDGDGVCDSDDPCPLDNPDDTDGDGACDTDDICPLDNPDDTDGDGVCDTDDPCPLDNPDDTDGDGVCDTDDDCPVDNPDDTDGDGVCDSDDPCPVDNPDDTDGDGACDTDDICPLDNPDDTDGDGVCDTDDICPLDNPDDTDGDGVCDTDDPCPLDNPDDSDSDGVCDTDDICPGFDDTIDPDNDGVPSGCDVCPNDDPGDADGDGVCDSDRVFTVFVTSTTSDGNLGGVAGADAQCTSLARLAGLPTAPYKAWLSDGTAGPSTTFFRSAARYELVDGTRVADHYVDLTDGTIRTPINVTDKGVVLPSPTGSRAWTGTSADGTPRGGGARCSDWTLNSSFDRGAQGRFDRSDSAWSFAGASPCNALRRLYCFEQPVLEPDPDLETKRIFVTSSTRDGNLGGAEGADDTCNALASDAGLPGIYKAWLSDATSSPNTTFFRSPAGYVRVDGTLVAMSYADLTDGSLLAPINLDENGDDIGSGRVWTGTTASGDGLGGSNCSAWSTANSALRGPQGRTGSTESTWSFSGASGCNQLRRLYCVQQEDVAVESAQQQPGRSKKPARKTWSSVR